MCSIIFDKYARPESIIPPLKIPQKAPEKPPPESGILSIKDDVAVDAEGKPKGLPLSFVDTFGDFAFRSMFTQQQLMEAVELIRVDCAKLQRQQLFKCSKGMAFMRLKDFNMAQSAQLTDVVKYLDKTWISDICTLINQSLASVEKGFSSTA